ncbi:MAG: transporter [Planctomycetes bacterium]|nr:transporter [Planctomycetota bacterium]
MTRALVPALALLGLPYAALAEDITPTRTAPRTTSDEARSQGHSWEMPALTVQGRGTAELREEDRIGSYQQPRWTARRRFTETRVYVVPEGQFEFEYWLIVKDFKKDKPTQIQHVYEAEIGLPYRFQLDLYQVYEKEDSTGPLGLSETKFELRYALADWGRIWGNPTLYGEWANASGDYDSAEFKLLLTDELTPRWHWATNFVYERKVGGDQAVAQEMTNALSYTLRDEKVSLGIEDKFAWEDVKGDRGNYEREFLLGPSIQIRPLPQMHIDLSYMIGLTDNSPASKTVFIAGWEF